jgi:EAL domain-containing protein (putative c-di-GMP-specific phosphodiesterase class I)/GGDEF domain-containing protein
MLFDPVTGLPTTPLLFPRIEALLAERGEVSLLCLNVVRYSRIEEVYGWQVFDEVLKKVATTLEGITGSYIRDADVVAELMVSGNAFVVVLSPPRDSRHIDPAGLDALVERVEQRMETELAANIDAELFLQFGCYCGSATIKRDPSVRMERLVYLGLETALDATQHREAETARAHRARLVEIIDDEDVRTVVHPVIRLGDLSIVGYEALTRGPAGEEFEWPAMLYKTAYDADLVIKLERLCRRRALEAATDLPRNRLFFLNVEPMSVTDPQLRDEHFESLMTRAALDPDRVVLEITERHAIEDFAVARGALEYLRALGFSIAVDDAGSGFCSFQCLAEIRPEWLKLDFSLVRGIETDDVRQQLVRSLVDYGSELGVGLVAEGIETVSELSALRELGVEYGQGFLFSKPVDPFPADSDYDWSALR